MFEKLHYYNQHKAHINNLFMLSNVKNKAPYAKISNPKITQEKIQMVDSGSGDSSSKAPSFFSTLPFLDREKSELGAWNISSSFCRPQSGNSNLLRFTCLVICKWFHLKRSSRKSSGYLQVILQLINHACYTTIYNDYITFCSTNSLAFLREARALTSDSTAIGY